VGRGEEDWVETARESSRQRERERERILLQFTSSGSSCRFISSSVQHGYRNIRIFFDIDYFSTIMNRVDNNNNNNNGDHHRSFDGEDKWYLALLD